MLKLTRPGTLESGRFYLRQKPSSVNNYVIATLVRFSGYTACPAVVIVQDRMGNRIRCSRDDLFILKESPRPFRMSILLKSKIQKPEVYELFLAVVNFFDTLIYPDTHQYQFSPENQKSLP